MWEVTAYARGRRLPEPVEIRHVVQPDVEALISAASSLEVEPVAVQALVALADASRGSSTNRFESSPTPLIEPIARWAEDAQEAAAEDQDDINGRLVAFRKGLAKTYGGALLAYARHDDEALVVAVRPYVDRLRVVYRPDRGERDLHETVWKALDSTGAWPWPRLDRELEVMAFTEESLDAPASPEIVPRAHPQRQTYEVQLAARRSGFLVLKPLTRLRRFVQAEERDALWQARSRWLTGSHHDDPDLFDLREDSYVDASVVLVPGLGSTGRGMYESLRPLGIPMAVYEHDTFLPIDQNAEELAGLVMRHFGASPLTFVCHSRGGLVARAAIDRMPSLADQIQLHTFGTPHSGTPLAEYDRLVPFLRAVDALLHPRDLIRSADRYLNPKTLFPPPGVLEMSPNNPFITRMQSTLHPELAFFGSWGATYDARHLSWKLRMLEWACKGIVPDPHDLIVEEGSCVGAGDPQGPLEMPATHFDYFSLDEVHAYLRHHLTHAH